MVATGAAELANAASTFARALSSSASLRLCIHQGLRFKYSAEAATG